ncbi:hypothetical protein [Escherichia coli]|nr:hypothetical protein [Escherichia coli]
MRGSLGELHSRKENTEFSVYLAYEVKKR